MKRRYVLLSDRVGSEITSQLSSLVFQVYSGREAVSVGENYFIFLRTTSSLFFVLFLNKHSMSNV